MNDKSNSTEHRLTTLMVSALQEKWRQEIEKAIDEIKSGVMPYKRRSVLDNWFRKQWHRQQALDRRRAGGPTIIRE